MNPKTNQDQFKPEIKQLHQAMVNAFVGQGRLLTKAEMAFQIDDLEEAIDFGACFFCPLMP